MKLIRHFLFALLLLAAVNVEAQVAIGTPTPSASAQLDITSTTKGLLIPRMTSAQRSPGIGSPAEGLMVYQVDAPVGIYVFKSGAWSLLSAGVSNPALASRATNIILNSGTYVDIVSVSLEANKTYFLESTILGQRVGATSGTGTFHVVYSGNATTDYGLTANGLSINDVLINATPSFDVEAAGSPSTFTTSVGSRYDLRGYIRTTSAGTLTVRGARASINTTVDLNVREGSFLMASPLN